MDDTKCRVCEGDRVSKLIEIPRSPVFCNLLCETRQEAMDAPRRTIQLGFCRDCGHIFNVVFDPELLKYGAAYENSLHFSERFRSYADDLAARLVDRYDLRGKNIVEVGCGRGDFLKSLCRLGNSRGFGFDPSYPGEADGSNGETSVTLYGESYLEHSHRAVADFLCCRHCLEHIGDPVGFLREHRDLLAEGTSVFFEVPNSLFTIRDGGIWDIIYEHCGYFWAGSLERAFSRSGFQVTEIEETFEGQFLTVHATAMGGTPHSREVVPALAEKLQGYVDSFSRMYRETMEAWKERLREISDEGRKAVVWGAGSKGNTFLNTVGEGIQYVVDVNPRKQGRFVAGTGQPIVSPEFLKEYRPDLVVVMNPIYRDEVRRTTEDLGLQPEFACP